MSIFIKKNKVLLFISSILSLVFSIILPIPHLKTAGEIVSRPTESNKVLNNPLMGFAPDARWIVSGQPYKLVFACITWSDIEPVKGKYNFIDIEKKLNLDYWHQHDIKIIFRIVMDYPSGEKHKDIPDWLYNEIRGDGIWYDNSYGKGFSPNYENPLLIYYHQKLISALGKRYNKSGDTAYIELGSLGHWGEWHTMQAPGYNSIPFPKESICNQYADHYIKSFPDKLLMMRRPFNISKISNIGVFNDMLGDHTATMDIFLSWINKGYLDSYTGTYHAGIPTFWKTSPSGGELANGDAGIQYFSSSKINDTLEQAVKTHISWIGPNCPAKISDKRLQNNVDTLLKTIGYRFVLSEVSSPSATKSNKTISVAITIKNKGVAPFYYKWPINIYLIDSKGSITSKYTSPEDIRKWLPGTRKFITKLYIPAKIKPGTYKIAISIDDPSTGKPSINFANDGKLSGGYFLLNNITIKN